MRTRDVVDLVLEALSPEALKAMARKAMESEHPGEREAFAAKLKALTGKEPHHFLSGGSRARTAFTQQQPRRPEGRGSHREWAEKLHPKNFPAMKTRMAALMGYATGLHHDSNWHIRPRIFSVSKRHDDHIIAHTVKGDNDSQYSQVDLGHKDSVLPHIEHQWDKYIKASGMNAAQQAYGTGVFSAKFGHLFQDPGEPSYG